MLLGWDPYNMIALWAVEEMALLMADSTTLFEVAGSTSASVMPISTFRELAKLTHLETVPPNQRSSVWAKPAAVVLSFERSLSRRLSRSVMIAFWSSYFGKRLSGFSDSLYGTLPKEVTRISQAYTAVTSTIAR